MKNTRPTPPGRLCTGAKIHPSVSTPEFISRKKISAGLDRIICAACTICFVVFLLILWPFVAASDRRKELEG